MDSGKKIILYLAIVLVVFTGCKTTVQIEKPRESYLPSGLQPVVSELPLHMELDIKKLEAAVNAKMAGLIFEGSNISERDLSIKVWKAQNFTFNVTNNVIEYSIPLKLWSRFAWKMERFGLSVGDHYEANGSITLTYRTVISIDKDWKLVSKTTPVNYKWLETPKLNVAGIAVPVTTIASYALAQVDHVITAEIDKALAQSVDLKKYVSMAWDEVQKPRLVNPENNVWIRVTPKDVLVSPFTTAGSKLNMSIALFANIESVMGSKPATGSKVPLPAFRYVARPASQFNLNIATDVTFDKISEMASRELKGKTFTEGKRSVTITGLSIFGSEGKAVFVADVIGSFKGRIYFTGNMVYNPEKVAVEITSPEFDVKTQSALVKSANWLMHGLILKKITPYLTYPVKGDLERMKAEVNQSLGNYAVYDGVTLQGKLNNLNVTSLTLVPGAVRIEANLKGNVGLKIQDFKF